MKRDTVYFKSIKLYQTIKAIPSACYATPCIFCLVRGVTFLNFRILHRCMRQFSQASFLSDRKLQTYRVEQVKDALSEFSTALSLSYFVRCLSSWLRPNVSNGSAICLHSAWATHPENGSSILASRQIFGNGRTGVCPFSPFEGLSFPMQTVRRGASNFKG